MCVLSRSWVVSLQVPVFYLRGGGVQHQISGGWHDLTVLLDESGNDHPYLVVLNVVRQSVLYWGQFADHCRYQKQQLYKYCWSSYFRWVKISLFLNQIQFPWHLISSYHNPYNVLLINSLFINIWDTILTWF